MVAYTNLTVYVLDKADFKWVFGILDESIGGVKNDPKTESLIAKLKGLTETWKSKYSQFINANQFFASITESQKTQISMFLEHEKVYEDDVLWEKGSAAEFCFFVYKGSIEYDTPILSRQKVTPGILVGDFDALSQQKKCESRAVVIEDSEILKISRVNLKTFLSRNPGIRVLLRGKFFLI